METKRVEPKKIGKHALIMVLCCLIPIAILAILWAVGVSSNYLIYGIILLCPLLHFLLMSVGRNSGGKGGGHIH